MAKNTLTVTDVNAQLREAPDFDILTVAQSNTDYLHGDGFWPLYMDKMAKVTPGAGLNIQVADYYALVDGYKLFTRGLRALNWNKYVTIGIPTTKVGTGDFYLLLRPKLLKTVDLDGDGIAETPIKEHGTGEFYFDTSIPSDGAIPVAKLNIPTGTTQITEAMIDNSVKVWLPDIQKSLREMKKYIDEAVERAKREIYDFILGEYTTQVRDEIAQGNATIRAELDAKCSALQNQINDLTVSVNIIRQSLSDFQFYVNGKIAALTTKTDALSQAIADLGNAVSENTAFIQELSSNISNIEGDIVALQLENQVQTQQIQQLQTQTGISQGIFDLGNAISLIKTNWSIQQIHNLGINQLYKGYTDILKDTSNIDATSINYALNSILTRIQAVKPLKGLISWWKFDEGMGNVALDSFGSNNGIIYNATWVDGKVEKALNFNGYNTYVSCGMSDTLNLNVLFTIAAWIKPNKFLSYMSWVARNYDQYRATMGGYANQWGLTWFDGSIWHDLWGGSLDIGQWNHVVIVVNGNDFKFYKNGALDWSTTATNNIASLSGREFRIGNQWGNGEYFDGIIDEVAIFNQALSASEVFQIYNQGISALSGTFTPGTVITKPVNYGIVPTKAVVSVVGNGITPYISRDNGTTWTQVTPDTEFTFTTEPSGSDIRLKFTLDTPDSYIDNYGLFVK